MYANLRVHELEKFSENASKLLLEQGRLPEFLRSIGCEVEQHGNGYKCPCPACAVSYAFIGTNGNRHKVFWRCFDAACPSNNRQSKLFRNLLGLVRGVMEGDGLDTAIKTIAKFLGYEGRSFDITNGRDERPRDADNFKGADTRGAKRLGPIPSRRSTARHGG